MKNEIKILYILHDTSSFSGASKALIAILKGLESSHYKAAVAMPTKTGIYQDIKAMGVKTIIAPVRYATYPRLRNKSEYILYPLRLIFWQICNFIALKKIQFACKKFAPDIIHSNVSVIDIGSKLANILNIPHVHHFREYADKDFNLHYYPSSEKYHNNVIESGSYNICITKEIMNHHQLPKERTRIIYDGIFHKGTENFTKQKDNYFLYAGRIEPAKGVYELLVAYNQYVKNVPIPTPLYIAGLYPNTRYTKMIQNYIDTNYLWSYVSFLGQRSDIQELYKHAKALIVPSILEGFGFCMPEAMYNGCIVIGHNTGGTKEQFDNGQKFAKQEIGFRYNTLEELTNLLKTVSEANPDSFNEMRHNAFKCVNEFYSIETSIEQILQFYKDVIKEYKK